MGAETKGKSMKEKYFLYIKDEGYEGNHLYIIRAENRELALEKLLKAWWSKTSDSAFIEISKEQAEQLRSFAASYCEE